MVPAGAPRLRPRGRYPDGPLGGPHAGGRVRGAGQAEQPPDPVPSGGDDVPGLLLRQGRTPAARGPENIRQGQQGEVQAVQTRALEGVPAQRLALGRRHQRRHLRRGDALTLEGARQAGAVAEGVVAPPTRCGHVCQHRECLHLLW